MDICVGNFDFYGEKLANGRLGNDVYEISGRVISSVRQLT